MDTNPMDDDHWWYRLSEKEKMGKYKLTFFKQPGRVVEYTKEDFTLKSKSNGFVMSRTNVMTNPKCENKKKFPTKLL